MKALLIFKKSRKWVVWLAAIVLFSISIHRLVTNNLQLSDYIIFEFEKWWSASKPSVGASEVIEVLVTLALGTVTLIWIALILLSVIYVIRKIFIHIILQEETIEERWGMMLGNGAGNAEKLRASIEEHLQASDIPYKCYWSFERVASSTVIQRDRRPFLIVYWKKFPNYRVYIGMRDFGKHLQVERFTTIETGIFKKLIAWILTRDKDGLSKPVNILSASNIIAWKSVVYSCVKNAVTQLMEELERDAETIGKVNFNPDPKGYVDVW